ncbi:arf-GAP with Rho-GAP domain, ANK repeat and PH domain-containing protein 1 isoform 2-T2 [Aulostomus maculatus]
MSPQMTPPPPVPKPRSCYMRDSLGSASFLDRDPVVLNKGQPSGDGDAPPLCPPGGSGHGPICPTLLSVTEIIATNIPSMAGVTASISDSTPPGPPVPLSGDSMTNSITTQIRSLAQAASTVDNSTAVMLDSDKATSVPVANTGVGCLESIISSKANIPSLADMVTNVASSVVDSSATLALPQAPTPTDGKPQSPSQSIIGADDQTDVGALSQLVMSTIVKTAGVMLPSLEGAAEPAEEGLSVCTNTTKDENPYATVLACWVGQEKADTVSCNEEDNAETSPTPSGADGQMTEDPALNTSLNSKNQSGHVIPSRPARPPPLPPGQSRKPGKHKTPRAATIRVSRKKGSGRSSAQLSTIARASWLDVWKGFRHNVFWATLDGQLMSLWKKRTDHFSEVMFHVTSITNVKKQDKQRFSVYFKKKHFDFMAHSDEVQDNWVNSLLASRGQASPSPPELHGPITIKDPRSRVYAAVCGHDLWIYPNKEGFQLGVASYCVPLNVASVKSTGRHSFTLTTPYRILSLSVESSKDLSTWFNGLSSSICSALSCSQVALRLWENSDNRVCGDCKGANPEWASVNLLLVICSSCAGHHRTLGSNLSKIHSLKMDNKVWTEPLIQLFVAYGNQLANQVWAPAVPVTEQLRPESSDEERSKFIQDKYSKGCYRRVYALMYSQSLLDRRLCEVVHGDDVEETMLLICSGAKVCPIDPHSPSPIQLAEKAGQPLQTELLRLNEYTEVPPFLPQAANRRPDFTPSGEEEEKLHGKLEEDRFLFSLENDSAACDVLDLREVLAVFVKDGPAHQFEIVTRDNQLICAADSSDDLMTHMLHILKVILPQGVSYAEVGGAIAISKVCGVVVHGASLLSNAWLLLWDDGISIHPVHRHTQQPLRIELSMLRHHEMDSARNTITIATRDRCVSLHFEEQYSCHTWFNHLKKAVSNQNAVQRPVQSLYPVTDMAMTGSVAPVVERCISHIRTYGLNVEGVYRRCGLAAKVSRLVEALTVSPSSAPLESDEQGVLDVAAALKQYIRQQDALIPERYKQDLLQAAVISDEHSRFSAFRAVLRRLPDDNRATLSALFEHLYMVQLSSPVNKMSAHNLALVLVPTLFQSLGPELLQLTREFIIHHTLLFLMPEQGERPEEGEEEITIL